MTVLDIVTVKSETYVTNVVTFLDGVTVLDVLTLT